MTHIPTPDNPTTTPPVGLEQHYRVLVEAAELAAAYESVADAVEYGTMPRARLDEIRRNIRRHEPAVVAAGEHLHTQGGVETMRNRLYELLDEMRHQHPTWSRTEISAVLAYITGAWHGIGDWKA